MRLLKTTTLEFADLLDTRKLSYAILSHRWGVEEVSYEDFLLTQHPEYLLSPREAVHVEAVRRRQGYAKIRQFCNLARKHGYHYCWIDTCCIDKRSSAELTEAINSMWAWYTQSAMCFVYLVDVPPSPSVQDLDATLRASAWFRRCWTLQEFLAPDHLRFLDAVWTPFLRLDRHVLDEETYIRGGKCEYLVENPKNMPASGVLSAASRIPMEWLLDNKRALRYASVAQKMSWAATRQATRTEDVAYSLLGLFGIHMPLLYGENDRAFMRLQHEIIRQMSDETIFAWKVISCNGHGLRCGAQTGKILPSHPWSFVDAGNVRRLRVDESRNGVSDGPGTFVERESPFQLTNRGLLMTVAPKIITKEVFPGEWLNWLIVPLMCFEGGNPDQRQCELVLKLCDILVTEGASPDSGGISVFSRVAPCSLSARLDHLPHDIEPSDIEQAEQLEQNLRIFANIGQPGESSGE